MMERLKKIEEELAELRETNRRLARGSRRGRWAYAVLAAVGVLGAWSVSSAAVPNSFVSGGVIRASELNENFDDLDTRIETITDRGNLYERSMNSTLAAGASGSSGNAFCDDANDVPVTVFCAAGVARAHLHAIARVNWTDTTMAAGANCQYLNNHSAPVGVGATIACIAVP